MSALQRRWLVKPERPGGGGSQKAGLGASCWGSVAGRAVSIAALWKGLQEAGGGLGGWPCS